jgi:hypothetical protein
MSGRARGEGNTARRKNGLPVKAAAVFFIAVFVLICEAGLASAPDDEGCTAFGATGRRVVGGGTLIARNRDKSMRGLQVMVRRRKRGDAEYLGITSKGHRTVTAGVNEHGLVIVNTAASSDDLPRKQPAVSCDFFLRSCATVSDVLALVKVGNSRGPINFLVGDPNRMALIELARGEYRAAGDSEGVLYHTNHYILEGMTRYNRKDSESSGKRLARIGTLLGEPGAVFSPGAFLAFSRDHVPRPSASSICRHPYLVKERSQSGTLASTIFLTREGFAPRIFVTPGEPCISGCIAFDFPAALPHVLTSGQAFVLAEEISRAYWLINPREESSLVRALSQRLLDLLIEGERLMIVNPLRYQLLSARLGEARDLVNRGRFREALLLLEGASGLGVN